MQIKLLLRYRRILYNAFMNNAYLSSKAATPLVDYLKSQGYVTHLLTGKDSPVYEAVSTHADIHMCRLGLWENVEAFFGNPQRLTRHYPGNIIYNAVCTGKYFIHNLKYTDEALLQRVRQWHCLQGSCEPLQMVHVPQGYTRCCCLPVDDQSFITADEGIAKALRAYHTDVLLIEKGHILLPGFDYGFIGGCAGHLITAGEKALAQERTADIPAPERRNRTILFNGNLSAHPDHQKIRSFLSARGITPVDFKKYPLTDIGSILTI